MPVFPTPLRGTQGGNTMDTYQVKVTSGKQGEESFREIAIDVEKFETLDEATEFLGGEARVLALLNRQHATNCKNSARQPISERNLVPEWVEDKAKESAVNLAATLNISEAEAYLMIAPKLRSAFRKGELPEG